MMKDLYCTPKTEIVSSHQLPAVVAVNVLDEIEDIEQSNDEKYFASECKMTTWYNEDNEPVENEWRVRLMFHKDDDNTIHFADLFFGDNCQLDVTRTQHMVFSKESLEYVAESVQKLEEKAHKLDEMNLFPEVA